MRVCGAGGNRTLVQTSDKCAFYMLSLLLVFENNQGISTRVKPYFLNLTKVPELYFGQPEIVALHGRTGIRQIHPRNVPSPLPRAAIKPIYYNSIRQQERSCFRQLKSLKPSFTGCVTWPDMLTNPPGPLSKPGSPIMICRAAKVIKTIRFYKLKMFKTIGFLDSGNWIQKVVCAFCFRNPGFVSFYYLYVIKC